MKTHGLNGASEAKTGNPNRREFGRTALACAMAQARRIPRAGEPCGGERSQDQAGDQALRSPPRSRPTSNCFSSSRSARVRQRRLDPRPADGRIQQIVKRYADAGITVWNIGNSNVHNMPEVTLNLPGRDQKIEEYKQYLRNLARAGIYYTTYAHMGNGIWSSAARDDARRRAARALDLAARTSKGSWIDKTFEGPLSNGRATRRRRSGTTTPTSFARSHRSPRNSASASASIRTIRPVSVWAACRAASSRASTATSARSRSPTARTSACACASAAGSKAARRWARIPSRRSATSAPGQAVQDPLPQRQRPLPHFVETFIDNGYTTCTR